MLADNKIWVAVNDAGERIYLEPKYANRHGLIAGATGTGKTVTLKVLAESFSNMGVPVFMADVKGGYGEAYREIRPCGGGLQLRGMPCNDMGYIR